MLLKYKKALQKIELVDLGDGLVLWKIPSRQQLGFSISEYVEFERLRLKEFEKHSVRDSKYALHYGLPVQKKLF